MIYINDDTGFPDETPCAGCGWPLYCCLCRDEDAFEGDEDAFEGDEDDDDREEK